MNINLMVNQFQHGNLEIFGDIYAALEEEKVRIISWLRLHMPKTISDHEIAAIFDDALLTAVEKYDDSKGATFTTYLLSNVISLKKNLLTYTNRKKRSTDAEVISLNAEDSAYSLPISEVIEDKSALQLFEGIIGSEFVSTLMEYSSLSEKNRVNVLLVTVFCSEHSNKQEKYEKLREITGKNELDATLKKRCQRARIDIAEYTRKKLSK